MFKKMYDIINFQLPSYYTSRYIKLYEGIFYLKVI